MERVQWLASASGGAATVATAVELVNRDCIGQCACGVADEGLQPSGNLRSTTPRQSTQTSAAVELTTVEPTDAVSSVASGRKNFVDLGVTVELEQDVAGEVILRLA